MKRIVVVLSSVAMVLLVFNVASAQVPKEGVISCLAPYSASLKVVAMGQERTSYSFELIGVIIGDSPDSIVHNASFRCVGVNHIVKGAVESSGFCVYFRPDGDRIFGTTRASGIFGKEVKRVWELVGGTGKFIGITGGGESTQSSGVPPAAEGTTQGYTKMSGRYSIP
jgi:hypothetical protein